MSHAWVAVRARLGNVAQILDELRGELAPDVHDAAGQVARVHAAAGHAVVHRLAPLRLLRKWRSPAKMTQCRGLSLQG